MVDSKSAERPLFAALSVGLYCLLGVAMFGAALVDRAYAHAVGAVLAAGDVEQALRPVADILLQLLAATLLAGLAAIASAWSSIATRNLLLASAVVLVAQLFAPALFANLAGSGWGFWLRVGMSGGTAVLALAALRLLRPAG
jgi:hypothetical protein